MIHHVYANQSNVGDWLSARGIQSLLAPFPVIEHFCDEPFVPETLRRLSSAPEDDFIIIGGGGLFMEYFAPFWEGFRTIAERVPFCLWGVGYCDLKHGSSRADAGLLAGIVQRSRLCIVRDALTHAHLRQCPLPAPVPCPALNAVPAANGATSRLLHVDHFSVVGGEVYEFMCRTAEKFAKETGRSYRQTNNLIPAGNADALGKKLALYASSDLVLTSRLHGCILALAMGRRVLAVSGDHKVESFMRAAGLGEWVCDLADIASLPERLGALPAQPVPREFVEAARRANVAVAAQIRSLLAQTQTALTGS